MLTGEQELAGKFRPSTARLGHPVEHVATVGSDRLPGPSELALHGAGRRRRLPNRHRADGRTCG